MEALQKNDEVYQTIVTSRKKGEFGGAFGYPPALRILKLIDIISAEDIVLLLLQLSEQAMKQEQLRRAEEKVQSSEETQLSRDRNTPLAGWYGICIDELHSVHCSSNSSGGCCNFSSTQPQVDRVVP